MQWMQGTVELEVTGLKVNALLAEARSRGMVLRDLRRPGRTCLQATLAPSQARVLIALAESLGMTARICRSRGLPALWLRVTARPTLMLSLVLSLGLLFAAATRIWEVRVVGAEGEEARAIQEFLAEEGLGFGAASGGQDINALEYRTRQAFPQLRFVGIRLAGMRATVTVAHAMGSDEAAHEPGTSVVASRAGVIERVTPSQGTPRIAAGDVVAGGQLLIEGVMEFPEGDERLPIAVAAEGEVIARIWVSARASGGLTRVEADPAGAVRQQWTLILGEKRIPLFWRQQPGDMLLESVRAWRLPGFAAAAPLALEKREYRQGKLVESDYSALLDRLRSQSGAEALRLLPEDAQVVDRVESISVEESTVTLTTRLEALCDIAERK